MKEFNYQDYVKYQELKRKEENQISYELADNNEKYNYVYYPHDKIFKTVLSDKKQVVELINRALELKERLTEDDIQEYNNNYIMYMFKNRESDIVYKMKEKEIFFLIEHQTKIDYSMPKRILEYEVEIIRKEIWKNKITKTNHKLPRVIPIVIYTGNGKWDVEKYIEECQEVLSESSKVKLGEYYVVDANDYTNEELEKDELFLSKMLWLEKLETEEEIFQMLDKTIDKEKNERNRDILKRIIAYILDEKLREEDKDKLLKKLEEEENVMVLEVIRKENERLRKEGIDAGIQQGIQKGIQKGVENVAIQMLKIGISDDIIKKVTNLNSQELEKIKKKIS